MQKITQSMKLIPAPSDLLHPQGDEASWHLELPQETQGH
jgi:hypothetical protein